MSIKRIIVMSGIFGLGLSFAGSCMAQAQPQAQPKQSFFIATRHAEIGEGISRISSFQGPKSTNYFVHCNCADLSSDTKICPTKGYQCACSPATVYCQ
jgi:hypothetical protein